MSKFTVTFTNDEPAGKTVQVFQKPPQPGHDYRSLAWQLPSGPSWSGETFDYTAQLDTTVTAQGAGAGSPLTRPAIMPGVLLNPPGADGTLTVNYLYQPGPGLTPATSQLGEPDASATDTPAPASDEP